MNILHIDAGKGWRGGQRQALWLIQSIAEQYKDVEQVLVCPKRSPLALEAQKKIPVIECSLKNTVDLFSMIQIRKAIKQYKIDIVQCHCALSHGLVLWMAKLFNLNIKIVVTRRVDFVPKNGWWHRYKYTSPKITAVVAISSAIAEIMQRVGVNESKVKIIHSSVQPPSLENKQAAKEKLISELKIPSSSILIGNVAHFADHKGHIYLVKAAKYLLKENDNLYFILVGEGELLTKIKELVSNEGLQDRILFLGFRSDVYFLTRAFDYFLMTSHMEGLCSSIIDAFFCETPVIATNAGGIPDLVQDGVTGRLAESKDPQHIAEQIAWMIKHPNAVNIMTETARDMAFDDFTVQTMGQKYYQLYSQIYANK